MSTPPPEEKTSKTHGTTGNRARRLKVSVDAAYTFFPRPPAHERVGAPHSARALDDLDSLLKKPAAIPKAATPQPRSPRSRKQFFKFEQAEVKDPQAQAEQAILTSKLPPHTVDACIFVAKILDIELFGLRAGSSPPFSPEWVEYNLLKKPMEIAIKSSPYPGPTGSLFPEDASLGRRDEQGRIRNEFGEVKTGSRYTHVYDHYEFTSVPISLADVIRLEQQDKCSIIDADENYVYFVSKKQNEVAARAEEEIIYRISITPLADSASAHEKLLSDLIQRKIGPTVKTYLQTKNIVEDYPPDLVSALALSTDEKSDKILYSVHHLEAVTRKLKSDPDAVNAPQFKEVHVHGLGNHPIGSDADVFTISVPYSILMKGGNLANAGKIYNSGITSEEEELRIVMADLIKYFSAPTHPAASLISLLSEHLEKKYKKNLMQLFTAQELTEDPALFASVMLNSIAFKNRPGMIKPMEVVAYCLINVVDDLLQSCLFTEQESELHEFCHNGPIQHAGDANFVPASAKEQAKVKNSPEDVLFLDSSTNKFQKEAEIMQLFQRIAGLGSLNAAAPLPIKKTEKALPAQEINARHELLNQQEQERKNLINEFSRAIRSVCKVEYAHTTHEIESYLTQHIPQQGHTELAERYDSGQLRYLRAVEAVARLLETLKRDRQDEPALARTPTASNK